MVKKTCKCGKTTIEFRNLRESDFTESFLHVCCETLDPDCNPQESMVDPESEPLVLIPTTEEESKEESKDKPTKPFQKRSQKRK